MLKDVIDLLGSPTFGVVLSLLLIFQWYKQHAKEQAVKNALFAMRRKVARRGNDQSFVYEPNRANDLVDDIDSVLQTLGSREPFGSALRDCYAAIFQRHDKEESQDVVGGDAIPEKLIDSEHKHRVHSKKSVS